MSETKQVALITGANKGIGFEIARQLGQQGIIVLVGARNEQLGAEAAKQLQAEGLDAVAIHLDVTDQATIDAAAALIDNTYGKLDILVNNAGISAPEDRVPPSELDIEIFKHVFDTNVFGAFAVTKAMLPLLRRAEAGRIVNVSSLLGSLTEVSDPNSAYANDALLLAYCASKTTMNALTVFFAKELQQSPIKINSVSPGYVATDLNGHRGFLTTQQGAMLPVKFATLPVDGPSGGFFGGEGAIPW